MDRAFEYIEANRERFLEELKGFVRQPSISATGEGVEACARLLKQLMENVGVETRVIEGYGHPVLYGEMTAPDAERTVLVYGHYDVQPPDPLSEWVSPPFEPVVRNGKLYGRGTGDNKGQLFAQLKGVESVVQALAGFSGNEELADSVNHLLVVGFYLVNLGFVLLKMRTGVSIHGLEGLIVYLASSLGFVLLVLGIAHFFNMYVINRFGRNYSVRPNTATQPARDGKA